MSQQNRVGEVRALNLTDSKDSAMHQVTRRKAISLASATSLLGISSLGTGSAAQAAESAATPAASFLAQQRFVIAHRGAGDVNPEHTSYAYTQAIAKGTKAVEISVRTTSDGQMICMHDQGLHRTTTNKVGTVSSSSLSQLKLASVDMRSFLGSGTPLQPISTLNEALDAIAASPRGGAYNSVGGENVILFMEAKDSASQLPMLKLLIDRGLQNRVVIKMYRNGAGGFVASQGFVQYAKNAGFSTWCYFDAADSLANISTLVNSPAVDAVGLPYFETVLGRAETSMSDQKIMDIVALGKPVIVWEVHRRWIMEHLASLGVRGFMSPDPYWLSYGGNSANLQLAQGRRLHGMLPAGQQDVANMPVWENGAIIHRQPYDESLMLGPVSHLISSTQTGRYVLEFSLKWEGSLPRSDWQYGYMAFGRVDDSAFGLGGKFDISSLTAGCYLLAVRPAASVIDENGRYIKGDLVQLLRLDPGVRNPVPLATIRPATAFAPNQEIACRLIISPQAITFVAGGVRSAPIEDSRYRGPYLHFGRYHGSYGDGTGGLALTRWNAYSY
ncbi:MAG: glycerophosphodiester phosphodiesterase family protein [Rothia sp. (in: high G+C Gram-positive bacteria)]|nr:glycerophosphodiester phosphodiesterase family protein [Rothia sp. (in: high G+C Gram-positive bacteria)]